MLMTWVLHGPALLLAWTDCPPPLCMDWCSSLFLRFSRQMVLPYLPGTHCTIPTSALVFGGNILHTLVSPLFMECKLHMCQSTFKASKQQWQQRGIAWTGPPCCMDRLASPLCMDRHSSLFLRFFRQVVLPYLAGTHCTIPTQGAAP